MKRAFVNDLMTRQTCFDVIGLPRGYEKNASGSQQSCVVGYRKLCLHFYPYAMVGYLDGKMFIARIAENP